MYDSSQILVFISAVTVPVFTGLCGSQFSMIILFLFMVRVCRGSCMGDRGLSSLDGRQRKSKN